MKKRLSGLFVLILLVVMSGLTGMATAGTLWYNGDLDNSGNYMDNYYTYHHNGGSFDDTVYSNQVYDDFVVPTGGWTINSVWSNNLFTSGVAVSEINYEIRSGVSEGNGGTLIASGSGTSSPLSTGRSYNGMDEYKVQVSGLNINLDPGTYWLNVTPSINYGDIYSRISPTSGASATGLPSGNNGNSYLNRHEHFGFGGEYNQYFVVLGSNDRDFSMGVSGDNSPVPIPGAVWLMGSALLGLIGIRRTRS